MIPPGLHLFTYSPPPKSNENPSNMAIRRGVLRFLESKQTLVYKYSAIEEVLVPNVTDAETGEELETRLTSDQLKTLDPKLAAYPLYKGNIWKKLTSAVKQKDVDHLIGKGGLVDSLMESPADEEVHIGKAEGAAEGAVLASASEDGLIQFVAFDAKRSWREGAVGEEISAFAMDKSWLWMDVVTRQFQGGMSLPVVSLLIKSSSAKVPPVHVKIRPTSWLSCNSPSSSFSMFRTSPPWSPSNVFSACARDVHGSTAVT